MKRIYGFASFVLVVAASAGLFQCSSGTKGVATGATCATGSTLTYATFGQAFMDKYCLECHAGKDKPDLSTLAAIQKESAEIMSTTAAGPTGTNTNMPEDAEPTVEERTQLGEWLACGAP